MTNLPTAEEIMQKHVDPHDCLSNSKCYEMTLDAMKDFAKLHVEAALKEASEKGKTSNGTSVVLKNSILNSYPLENIK